MVRVFLVLLLSLCVVRLAYADRVFLKSGEIIVGEIIEETRYSVKIRVGDLPYVYFMREIDSIERDVKPKVEQDLSEAEKAAFTRFLEVTGAKNNIDKMVDSIIKASPPESQVSLIEALRKEELMMETVLLYAKHYSLEEIQAMTEFYSSPLGQKQLKLAPILLEETLDTLAQYFKEKEILQKQGRIPGFGPLAP